MATKHLIALFSLLLASQISFSQSFDLQASISKGKSIYSANCVACHMANGEGIASVFPPLAGADNLDDTNRMVKAIMLGERGKITVNGVNYNGEMTGFNNLSDEEVADLLNYIKNSWGNKGEAILPKDIQPALKADVPDFQAY
ncbi:c-type cytochrome [Chondrinema litorale]|uniref:c-type cytochrome n=1 Tax=Chondrinema litorale TaxID=2994555 RepID=UPI002542E1DA|nr:cytochrome c [Chondrinema litorale]UZR96731.1 cytochrome c [Chondrinema litorale]